MISTRASVAYPPEAVQPDGLKRSNSLANNSNVNHSSEPGEKKKSPVWLNAWTDPLASLTAFPNCISFADLNDDGDERLLIADQDRRLKVFKGTSMQSEHVLLSHPCAVCPFYADNNTPRTPAIGIASGPFIYIYRNLRPYYKFTLPPVDIASTEAETWSMLREDKYTADQAVNILTEARDSGIPLSSRSLDLLALTDASERLAFIQQNKQTQIQQQTVAACMATLQKDSEQPRTVCSLVVGTENKQVLLMDPSGTSILKKFDLPSVPVFMSVQGLHDVEYRIVCACRNGNIYTIKNHKVLGGPIELESAACSLVLVDKNIVVGCMDQSIHSYSVKGKKIHSLYMPERILCMTSLELTQKKNIKCLLVSLANGEIRLYNGKYLISSIKVDDPVVAMKFGSYAREDATLALVHRRGALSLKVLARNANLESTDVSAGPPPEQDIPLNVPKKTKLYVEQTEREREQAGDMHRVFQRELCKLRLNTARAYVKIITDVHGSVSNNGSSLRLHVTSQGLGPLFKIKFSLKNTGNKPVTDVPVSMSYNPLLYRVPISSFKVPLILPGIAYDHELLVHSIDPTGAAEPLQIFVCSQRSAVPAISAILKMPQSELPEQ